ncbi:amidase family protein [Ruegeria marina]|uniref:Mandelamide amidase n=1 Tax=Ruegeria marina TaxID=639004 RepID=A0A1G6VDY0_9RHOB|nr:amidase family protein [Ruegeria marina]SDD51721.1 mandelamide amidase [Ruegeria marina]
MDLCNQNLCEAAKKIRDREFSSEEYVSALIDQAERRLDLNLFTQFDPDKLQHDARAADDRLATGRPDGPLHGVPIAIKDCVDVAGLATTCGTPALRNNRVRTTAPFAQKVFDAGALLMGKTNLHELAFGITSSNEHIGAVPNPHDPAYSAGGSSSGSAAAVAAQVVPAALGTDTAGSIRIPAAHCGVFGFRPSHGRYSCGGIMPLFPTRDAPGYFARTASDLALMDSVLTGDWHVPEVDLAGLRLGIPGDYFLSDLEAELATAFDRELQRLAACGVVLAEAPPPDFGALVDEAAGPVRAWELPRSLSDYLDACGQAISLDDVLVGIAGDYVRDEFADALADADASGLFDAYQATLTEVLPRHRAKYLAYLSDHDLSAIVFPTTPTGPTKLGDNVTTTLNGQPVSIWHTFRNALPATFLGAPGLSVPFARTSTGLPLGLEFDGVPSGDRPLLAIARAWSQSFE